MYTENHMDEQTNDKVTERRPKPTKIEQAARIAFARGLLRKYILRHDATEQIRVKYGVSIQVSNDIYNAAVAQLQEEMGEDKIDECRSKMVTFLESILADPDASDRARTQASDQIAKLLGLHRPRVIRVETHADPALDALLADLLPGNQS